MHPVVFELYKIRLVDFWTTSQLKKDYTVFEYYRGSLWISLFREKGDSVHVSSQALLSTLEWLWWESEIVQEL